MKLKLSSAEAIKIGKDIRDTKEGNLVIGAFAAELIGNDYPMSKGQMDVVFKPYTDEQLGHKFTEWCEADHVG